MPYNLPSLIQLAHCRVSALRNEDTMNNKREKYVKYDALDYRWHQYYEVSFQFLGDDNIHVFALVDETDAYWAYYTAMENELIAWAAVHRVWYGRLFGQINNSWQYNPLIWFGID